MLVELEKLLSQLNSFRTNKKFCDVIFIIDGEKFYAHRAVLAANVEYFNAMFSDNFAERNNLEIPLKGISSIGFKVFLDFIYCYDDVELDRASVKDVLTVSLYYNTDSLTNKCFDFIKTYINANNVLEYYELADSLSYDALKSYASSFLIIDLKLNTRSLDDILADISLITLKNFIKFSSTNEVASNALRNWLNDGNVQQQDEFNRMFKVFRNACSSSDCSEINNLMSIKKNIYIFQKVINERSKTAIVPWRYDDSSTKYLQQMESQSFFISRVVSLFSHNGKAYLYKEYANNNGNFNYYCTTKEQWIDTDSLSLNLPLHQLVSSDFDNSIYSNIVNVNTYYSNANIYYYKVDLNTWVQSEIKGYATADNEKILEAFLVSYRNCIFSCSGKSIRCRTLYDTLMLDIRANLWIRKCDVPKTLSHNSFNPIAVLDNRLYWYNYPNLHVYDIRADKWLKSAKGSKLEINYLIPYQNTLYGLEDNCGYFNIYDPVSDDWKTGPSFARKLNNCCGAVVV